MSAPDFQVVYSTRGLKYTEPIDTTYGHRVQVYESSAAEGVHIWLAVDRDCRPGVPITEEESAHAHLTLAQAEGLRDRLDYLIRNHYQVTDGAS